MRADSTNTRAASESDIYNAALARLTKLALEGTA
jgi:hypothetical protein